MPYYFSPNEKIENILHVIKAIHDLWHDSDSEIQGLIDSQLQILFMKLLKTIDEMQVMPSSGYSFKTTETTKCD